MLGVRGQAGLDPSWQEVWLAFFASPPGMRQFRL